MIFAGTKKKDTRLSVFLAICIHAIIMLLCFLFLRFKLPDPPLSEQTVELTMADFGNANTGANFTDGSPQNTQNTVEEAAAEEAIVDNNSETSAAVQETPSNATQPSQTQTNTQTQSQNQSQQTSEPEQQVSDNLSNLLNNMNGGGDGGGSDSGDQGTQNGKIDGKGVFGDGSGWSLSGRNMTGKPKFNGTPKKNGTVQVRIVVGKDGKVRTAKIVHSPPTNTSDQALFNLALAAAKTAKFNKDDGANINQSGTITFVFKVN